MLPRSCSPIDCEITLPLSQNCAARVTEILAKVAVEGDDQSVNSTGSQTTKVRTCLPARLPKMWSNAEAPCRHTGQVGDKSSRTRTPSFAVLKSFLISTTFCAVTFCSGGWPEGVWLPPNR